MGFDSVVRRFVSKGKRGLDMDYLESFVQVNNGEFPFIRFGTGKKNFVILAGMSMTGLSGLGAAVSEMYRDFAKEYTVTGFKVVKAGNGTDSVESIPEQAGESAEPQERGLSVSE